MITIANASIYSMKEEMAYEIEYSNGSKARAVVSKDGWIRTEGKDAGGDWISGKTYIVKKNIKRQGERLIETVKAFIGK